jgi:hypothetical protein
MKLGKNDRGGRWLLCWEEERVRERRVIWARLVGSTRVSAERAASIFRAEEAVGRGKNILINKRLPEAGTAETASDTRQERRHGERTNERRGERGDKNNAGGNVAARCERAHCWQSRPYKLGSAINGEPERSTRYVSKLDQLNASLTLCERLCQQLRLNSDE